MAEALTTRDQILEAAVLAAGRDGLLAMTLDNVARQAGISKGGVMYHFRSKDELVRGMLEYFGRHAEQMLMRRIAADPDPHFRWARAMLSCFFPGADDASQGEGGFSPKLIEGMMLTMLAAAVNNPGVFDPLRQLGRTLRERLLSDPENGIEQLLVWLAVDGLMLWQFVGMIDRDDPLFERIGEALRAKVASRTQAAAPGGDGHPTKASP